MLMVVKLSIVICAFAFLVGGNSPSLAKKRVKVNISNVLSGAKTHIYKLHGSNPDCSERKLAVIRITKKPKHGLAEVSIEKGYSSNPKDHQRYPCNLRVLDISVVYYKSNDGCRGRDDVSIEWFTDRGGYGRRRYSINVR
jgi:hypothetical protein